MRRGRDDRACRDDRRRFLVAAGALLAAPLARAQQPGRRHRIGWLDHSSSAENLGTFVQAMGALGWVDGKTFRMEYRGAEGNPERLGRVATELAGLPADVIVAPGTREALAAKKATSSVPVIFTGVDDPVERGLVSALARPGGNITGVASDRRELGGKLLSLLRELFPENANVAVLTLRSEPDHQVLVRHIERAARTLGVSLRSVQVARHAEVDPALAAIKKQGSAVVIVPASSVLVPRWIADLALKHRLPMASTSPDYVYEGGLIAYTDDWSEVFGRVATYVDRVLKGARPAELPVELPRKFNLIINDQTSKALGLAIPMSIVIRADHIVE